MLDNELVEMKRCRTNGLCCGAGGAQMFKEDEAAKTKLMFIKVLVRLKMQLILPLRERRPLKLKLRIRL